MWIKTTSTKSKHKNPTHKNQKPNTQRQKKSPRTKPKLNVAYNNNRRSTKPKTKNRHGQV